MNQKGFITCGLIVVVVLLVIIFLILTICNSKDCSQLVIDTYELHSGIDIPDVHFISCYYDEEKEVRISIYQLKTDINFYIDRHYFEFIKLSPDSVFQGFGMLHPDELPKNEGLYYIRGERWGRQWQYLVEKETERLWVELSY